ncbi:hypothetical protein ACP70R_006203 [Stipagrostis hirtigluma subsp. patula]
MPRSLDVDSGGGVTAVWPWWLVVLCAAAAVVWAVARLVHLLRLMEDGDVEAPPEDLEMAVDAEASTGGAAPRGGERLLRRRRGPWWR